MTFGEAKQRVLEYIDWNGNNAETMVENWINMTRLDIASKYNFEFLLTKATTTTVEGVSVYNFPDNMLEPYLIFMSDSSGSNLLLYPLSPKYYSNLVNIPEAFDLSSDVPPYRVVFRGNYFEIAPAPPAGRTLTMYYYKRPDTFSSDGDSDYLLNTYPEAVIFGAAWRGAVYLDDQQKVSVFLPAYQQAVRDMIAREKRKQADRQGWPRFRTWKDFDPATLRRMFGVM